jgi:hypothetical protein
MTTKPLGTFGRLALFFLPCVAVFAVLLVAIHLLHPRPAVVNGLVAAVSLCVFGYSLLMGHQEARSWDEVQKAGAGFSHANGWVWGGFATLALLMAPPVMNSVVDVVMNLPPAGSTDIYLGIRLGLLFGAVLVMLMQGLAIVVASLIWKRRMQGPGNQS